ncbi:MAG: hypothetical protein HFI91_07895 [Lachnospiraceae bacterium]|jgi:glutamate dehydrogenase/leucine dehydrogenase|nr:hypothetical protein [Lachnospiraceae bacterium]
MKNKILTGITSICLFGAGVAAGVVVTAKILTEISEEYRKSSDKFGRLFRLMSQWVQRRQEGKSISSYFHKNGYHTVAVYGMGRVGETLIKELTDSDISVKYAIDQSAGKNSEGFIVSPDSALECVDVVVVTPIASYGEIKLKLKEKMNCPIVSIEDILFEV